MNPIKLIRIVFIGILFQISVASAQTSVEHRVWNKEPLRINLPIGVERTITFPGEVFMEIPSEINDPVSRIQVRSDGTVYWLANGAFNQKRIIVKSKFGRVYLLDVSAIEGASTTPIVIVDELINSKYPKNTNSSSTDSQQNILQNITYDYVDLMRFAAQSMYAPKRLIKAIPGITKFPVIHRSLPIYQGQTLTIVPIKQWKTASIPSLYVVALKAINNTSKLQEIDVRKIRGKWLARTSQHGAVGSKGSATEETTIYLISNSPLQESIR